LEISPWQWDCGEILILSAFAEMPDVRYPGGDHILTFRIGIMKLFWQYETTV